MCFELHGRRNTHFNLISDTCVSVNALYRGTTAPDGQQLNIISSIGIRAENINGDCINIQVDLAGCSVSTGTGESLSTLDEPLFSAAGITIRKRSVNRVRVSVPNCENTNLMMWVICEQRNGVEMIRFQVARGINLRPTSHGLIGK